MTTPPHFDGPRLLEPGEIRASHRLSQICFSDNPPAESDPEPAEVAAQTQPSNEETYVITAEGVPVSQITILFTPLRIYDSLVTVGSIGGVCTHPDFRKYGLASRLLEHCAQRLVEGGARLMLISGWRGLYTRAGNVLVGKYASFMLKPGQLIASPTTIHMRPAQPADAAAASRLYQAEPVHFLRPLDRFSEEFQPHEHTYQSEQWMIEMDGQDAAYLALVTPWDYIGKTTPRVRYLSEYAGSRAALAAAIVQAAEQFDELEVPVAWQDLDLIHNLRQCGGIPQWSSLREHTIRVINFPGLMQDQVAYIQARLDPSLREGLVFEQSGALLGSTGGDRFVIRRGADRLELDGAAMTRLVMGDSSGENDLAACAPGVLPEIISALFPLPSFYAGFDYH